MTSAARKRRARYHHNKALRQQRFKEEERARWAAAAVYAKACLVAPARRAPCPVTATVFARTSRSLQVGKDVTQLIQSYFAPRPMNVMHQLFLNLKMRYVGRENMDRYPFFQMQWKHYCQKWIDNGWHPYGLFMPFPGYPTNRKKPYFTPMGFAYGKTGEDRAGIIRTSLLLPAL